MNIMYVPSSKPKESKEHIEVNVSSASYFSFFPPSRRDMNLRREIDIRRNSDSQRDIEIDIDDDYNREGYLDDAIVYSGQVIADTWRRRPKKWCLSEVHNWSVANLSVNPDYWGTYTEDEKYCQTYIHYGLSSAGCSRIWWCRARRSGCRRSRGGVSIIYHMTRCRVGRSRVWRSRGLSMDGCREDKCNHHYCNYHECWKGVAKGQWLCWRELVYNRCAKTAYIAYDGR